MTFLVSLINSICTALFRFIMAPFGGIHPFWPILLVSLVTGIAMLWIFGKVSNQNAIRAIRDRIRGNLLAVRLYQHDVKVVLKLQGTILCDTGRYVRHSLIPFLVLVVPVFLILAQLNLYFSVRPLQTGEVALVKARLQEAAANVTLYADSLQVETPPVRIPSLDEVSWRIRASEPGRHLLRVQSPGKTISKEIVVGPKWSQVPTLRTSSALDLLLYPGEPALAKGSPIGSVEILYPPLAISVLGWNIHWLVLFFVLSIAFAFAFRKPLGVEI